LNDYDAVFVARLRFTTLTPDNVYAGLAYEDAQFVVLEVFKGPLFLGQPILLHQYVGKGYCSVGSTNEPMWIVDIRQAEGGEDAIEEPAVFSKEWLIYGDGPPYDLNMCSRTLPLNMGGDKDLPILRNLSKRPPKRH
jgi:hypothetical protein